jgi:putative sigma-54 modulation protein
MRIEHIGKNIDLTDFIKAFTEGKLERLKNYFKEIDVADDSVEVKVVYTYEKHGNRNRVDMHININSENGGVLHAWEESNDLYTAIDYVIDEIERQLVRLKARRKEQIRRLALEKEKNKYKDLKEESIERPLIVQEPMPLEKPLTVEDALLILQETGAFFLPFRNAQTNEINILYRKKAGNYGLIVPGT